MKEMQRKPSDREKNRRDLVKEGISHIPTSVDERKILGKKAAVGTLGYREAYSTETIYQ